VSYLALIWLTPNKTEGQEIGQMYVLFAVVPVWAITQALFVMVGSLRLMNYGLLKWWAVLSPTLIAAALCFLIALVLLWLEATELGPVVGRWLRNLLLVWAISQGFFLMRWNALRRRASR
jgi:hypothetical protein